MIDKEKVHKLADFLRVVDGDEFEEAITEWLEQNKPKPVVVGLSDKQVRELSTELDNLMRPTYDSIERCIKDFLKTQTFAEPCECGLNISQIQKDQFKNLQTAYEIIANQKEELEQLKSQQFTPSWDDAPSWANWLAQDSDGQWVWYNKKPVAEYGCWASHLGSYDSARGTIKNWQQTLQERPKPTPQVGQVWKHSNDCKYQIDSLGETKFNEDDGWVDCVTYRSLETGKFYTQTLSDFFSKFKQA